MCLFCSQRSLELSATAYSRITHALRKHVCSTEHLNKPQVLEAALCAGFGCQRDGSPDKGTQVAWHEQPSIVVHTL